MQFAQLPVLISSIIIINTISDVRRLLHLDNECTGTNSMHTTCRHIENIPRPDGTRLKHFIKSTVMHPLFILLRRNLTGKTRNQCSPFISRNHIPHFIFTKTVMPFFSQFVTRVNLNGQLLPSINKLNQQREFITKTGIIALTNQFLTIPANHFGQSESLIGTIGHNRLATLYGRHFPTLSHVGQIFIQMFERNNLVAPPKRLLQNRLKFQRIHLLNYYV